MGMRGTSHARFMAAGHPESTATHRAPLDPRAILTSIGEVVYDWDIATDTISWGVNAAEVFGLSDVSALSTGKAYALCVEPETGPTRHESIFEPATQDEGSGVAYRTRYAMRPNADQVVMVEDTGRWYADSEGRAAFAHGVIRIDRTVSAGSVLASGSRSRSMFLDQIGSDVADAGRSKRALTLIVAAIEDLGRLNEDLGYEDADAVIQEVTARIRTVMRRRDRLARYSGNRFAVALMSCPAEQAATAARRLASAVESQPIATSKGSFIVRLRIGGASAPEQASDAAGLLRRAEEALAAARRGYGRPFVIYDPAQVREATRTARGTPTIDLVEALNARRIVFARQPVVDARSRLPAFHEALVRIRGSDGRLVTAGDILPSVERAGLVPLVDARMLELTADYLALNPDERLSINVSPTTIENTDWLGNLAAHLGARPGIESRLIIEVTETAAVRDPQATRARLDAMKALGVAIAIDDFGAGHTSFKHLRSFPVDILKIDGAFVQNLSRSTDDRFFVRTLVDLAHHLGISTVAEWVEDEETALMLAEWGIDYLQGDHCGAPCVVGSDPEERRKAQTG